MQYPEQLGRQRANGKEDTRDIAARPLDACDQTNSDRVGSNDEYDRRRRGYGFACLRRFADELPASLTWPKNYYRSWLISIGCRSSLGRLSTSTSETIPDVAARARGDADYPTSLSRYSRWRLRTSR